MTKLKIPQNLSLINAINFCNRLWKLEKDNVYEFDFRQLGKVEPFTMAYVANELKRFSLVNLGTCSAINFEDHSYAAHMGFYKAFGLQHGKEPGEATGSSTYIPLTILKVEDIKKEAALGGEHVGDVLEGKSKQIAQMLVQQAKGNLVDTLTFSIREIMRNVVEHSESDIIEYCAQYWPTKNLVEVAVLDTGNGIRKGIETNPYLEIESERDALHLSLLPGVSGKMYKGVKERKHDEWQNSGFGLYMTSRICRNGGSFFIVSNDSSVLLTSNGKRDIECDYKGTALRLQIDTSSITDYKDMLTKFRNEGYETAKRFSGDDAIQPSVASTMLARDFQDI
ncbi:MAG: hypothetical protein AUJ48_04055 [Deltaproteobacteria bacterium CG1_02_45_11]|nr:MAG: hypothetical protein AUJ48_04055 [Deltaproteobacteria bacterium CG1_02_45_11]